MASGTLVWSKGGSSNVLCTVGIFECTFSIIVVFHLVAGPVLD